MRVRLVRLFLIGRGLSRGLITILLVERLWVVNGKIAELAVGKLLKRKIVFAYV